MIRTFTTHNNREQKELTGCYWNFSPCQGENAGNVYQVPIPSCWENYESYNTYVE
jgi:beta-glucuronidase